MLLKQEKVHFLARLNRIDKEIRGLLSAHKLTYAYDIKLLSKYAALALSEISFIAIFFLLFITGHINEVLIRPLAH
jgi:hypothetical protein